MEGKGTRLQSAQETVDLMAKGEWVFLRAPLQSNKPCEKMVDNINFARAYDCRRK